MLQIDTGRLRGVLDLVVASSNWGEKLPPRQGRGVAVHRSFLSYVRVVAHVAVGNDGQVTIPRLDMAIDRGTVVNPDRVRAQLEGAPIMGIGNALYGNITVKGGRIQQRNYTDYIVPRIHISPRPTSTSSRTNTCRAASANPACRPLHLRSATRSLQQPATASPHCRSIRSC